MIHRLIRLCAFSVVAALTLSGRRAHAAPTCGQRAVSFVHISQDSRKLIAGIQDTSQDCSGVVGIDFHGGRIVWRVQGMMNSAHSALSRDGNRLAISYAGKVSDGSAPFVVLDAASGHIVSRLSDDRASGLMLTGGDAVSVALSPDGKEVYASLRNGWLAAWDADTGRSLFTQDPPAGGGSSSGTALNISPDGRLIMWSRSNGVYLLKLPPEHTGGRDTVATVIGHVPGRNLHDAALSPDGHFLAVVEGAVPGNLVLWSVAPLRALPPVTGCGGQIAWSSDSKSVACQTNDAVQLVSLPVPRRVLQSIRRNSLETPLTPLATGTGTLLYNQQSPHAGDLPPLVFSSFGGDSKVTIALP
jgi:WD40 repeat protein